MRAVLALMMAIAMAGCLGPNLDGTLSVEGNEIQLELTNRSGDSLNLLDPSCHYGASLVIKEGDEAILGFKDVVTDNEEPCTVAPFYVLEDGESVTTSWTWQAAPPGNYTAVVDFFAWEKTDTGADGEGSQIKKQFTIE